MMLDHPEYWTVMACTDDDGHVDSFGLFSDQEKVIIRGLTRKLAIQIAARHNASVDRAIDAKELQLEKDIDR